MKNILVTLLMFVTFTSISQTLSYNDIGVLFTKNDINGTARFNAMGGAFGALGGDLSGMVQNPAGAAVFLKSEFSLSLNVRNTDNTSLFYNSSQSIDNDYSNLSQAGGVFVFDTGNSSEWMNIALGFNYTIANDFENEWFATGNSGFAPITDFYDSDPVMYEISDGHYLANYTNGRNNKYTFTIASQYNEDLYIGAALNTYDVEFYQSALNEEYNSDSSGNTFDVSQTQELATFGDGYSFSFGIISKPTENIRLGLAYQSPVWYRLSEEFVDYDVTIYENDLNTFEDFSGINAFDYKLRTPSELTGSFAYIFGTIGLISVDYIHKNFSNITLRNANFAQENTEFETTLESTGELRLGTEWRFKNITVRGGYFNQSSPYKNASTSENIDGYSLGLGFKFRSGRLDLGYQKASFNSAYNMYPQFNTVNSVDLETDFSNFSLTLVLNI